MNKLGRLFRDAGIAWVFIIIPLLNFLILIWLLIILVHIITTASQLSKETGERSLEKCSNLLLASIIFFPIGNVFRGIAWSSLQQFFKTRTSGPARQRGVTGTGYLAIAMWISFFFVTLPSIIPFLALFFNINVLFLQYLPVFFVVPMWVLQIVGCFKTSSAFLLISPSIARVQFTCEACGRKMIVSSVKPFSDEGYQPRIVKLRCEECNLSRLEHKANVERHFGRVLPEEFQFLPGDY